MSALAYPTRPIRGRLNAWFFDAFDGLIDHYLHERKSKLFAVLPAEVVEIGPGVGANFRYYRPGTRVIAIEPNPEMHQRLRANAETHGIDLEISHDMSESIGLPDKSIGAVVSSLVLCTVESPERVVDEVRRILKPGGRFLFLEHVSAKTGWLDRLQRLVWRPWRYVFEGCELDRDLEQVLSHAGFSHLALENYRLRSIFVPVNSQIVGMAVR